jgi:hypothetical protein
MADEPFLEAALDDKSKIVRREAAAVLSMIPGSRLRARLSQAARSIVTVRTSTGLLRRTQHQVVLTPPESFDPAWERDGLEERPPKGVGPRAWWLRQILAAADLDVWTAESGLAPDEILESLQGDDFVDDARQALVLAASAARDAAWSAALVRSLLGRTPIDVETVASVLAGVPDDGREPLLVEIGAHSGLTALDKWTIAAAFAGPWSVPFSIAVMAMLGQRESREFEDAGRLARAIDAVSRVVAPEVGAAFEGAVHRSFPGTPPDMAMQSVARIRLRADMHQELTA